MSITKENKNSGTPFLTNFSSLFLILLFQLYGYGCLLPHKQKPLCKNHFNGTLQAIANANFSTLIHLDVAGNDFSGAFPLELCNIKDCTAWGNHFSTVRPKSCCAGLTDDVKDDDVVLPAGYVCHAHNFPGLADRRTRGTEI